MIVLFLSGMVAMIMMRTLHRDISNYNQLETVEEAQEETGWKLVSFVVGQQCCPVAKHGTWYQERKCVTVLFVIGSHANQAFHEHLPAVPQSARAHCYCHIDTHSAMSCIHAISFLCYC